MTALPVQRRRRSVLMVLAVALTLALLPHPKSPKGPEQAEQAEQSEDLPQHLGAFRRFLAMAQEPHGQFHFGAEGTPGAVEPPLPEDLEERLAEAENASVSLTLLGCMGFVMATFYLVNWPDDDIRQISLEVINSTISVFGSLLLFHTFEELLEHYVLPEMNQWQEVMVSMLQMLLWFALLQLVLCYYSGALGQNQAVRLRSDSLGVAKACGSPRTKACLMKSAERHLGVIKMNTEAWGILLGHATGFAATKACSQLQQAVPRNFFCVALMPLVSFGIIILVYRATEFLRYKITMRDGQEDEFEELWRERTAETEDEVIALAVSFSIAQMLRFAVSGHLPDALGEDPEGFNLHSNWSCALEDHGKTMAWGLGRRG
ncbi:unnamed protein product [Cladocopium goreaui]|uniref:Uncharacterized protein n=1 Tax=Cladocopium goreaui TaxID=2562237 RepID=A0A9P1M0Q4_9DINO|nr:unnamed protein product [Cladocopium goreaui]